MSTCISRVALSLLSTMKLSYQKIQVANRRRSGGPGGDLRWRSSLRLAPAPPIYEVMGDHGSPTGISAPPTIIHVDSLISKFHSTEQTQRDSGNTHGHWVRHL